jgi:hypothetical protein
MIGCMVNEALTARLNSEPMVPIVRILSKYLRSGEPRFQAGVVWCATGQNNNHRGQGIGADVKSK